MTGNDPPTRISLELLCLEQEETIEKQAAQIRGLLNELCLLRAADEKTPEKKETTWTQS